MMNKRKIKKLLCKKLKLSASSMEESTNSEKKYKDLYIKRNNKKIRMIRKGKLIECPKRTKHLILFCIKDSGYVGMWKK